MVFGEASLRLTKNSPFGVWRVMFEMRGADPRFSGGGRDGQVSQSRK